jgi:starch-binding outer membrane protein SusE/F
MFLKRVFVFKKIHMKFRSKFLFAACLLFSAFLACTKMSNTYFPNGTAPVLKSSTTSIAPVPGDSSNVVLALSWTNPHYSTDSGSEKYIIQIDSSGRNFAKATNIVISGSLSDSLTAKQINTIALGFGFAYNTAYNLDVRVVSSYSNNNEQYNSNTITINYTTYVIPPKVQPPTTGALFLVGSASQGGWNNPVPVPTQVFEQVDSVDYAGVFNLIGGQQYLALPKNGDWTNKFATSDVNQAPTGGTFNFNASTNFTGPTTSGWYVIWFNFQSGMVSITPYSGFVPDSLYIVGSATAGGWNNPVPVPAQELTQINSSEFQVTLPLSAAGQYLLLPKNGDWTNKYAVGSSNDTTSGGTFGYNGNNGNYNSNFPGPAAAGNYQVTANFLNWTYIVH